MSGTRPASPPILHPGYKPGTGIYAMVDGTVASAAVPAADKLYLYPFILHAPITFTSGYMRVSAGGAGSSVKAGIWANGTGATNRPVGAPLFADNTGVATTSSPTNVSLGFAGTLAPGIYWSGAKLTGTMPSMVLMAATNLSVGRLAGVETFGLVCCGLSIDDTYSNNLPTIAEGASFTVLTSQSVPVLGLTT